MRKTFLIILFVFGLVIFSSPALSQSTTGPVFLEETVNEEAGDVAYITIFVENKKSEFQIESSDYKLTADITDKNDNGKITLKFNTHLAGTKNSNVLTTVEPEDSVEVTKEDSLEKPLPAGRYPLKVKDETGEADSSELSLDKPTIKNITVYSLPDDQKITSGNDIERMGKAKRSIQNGSFAIHVEVSGIYGVVSNKTNPSELSDIQGMELNIFPKNSSLSLSDGELYVHEHRNSVYLYYDELTPYEGVYTASVSINSTNSPYEYISSYDDVKFAVLQKIENNKKASIQFNSYTVENSYEGVRIQKTVLPQGGYIAVYENGVNLGQSEYLSPGQHSNVSIKLEKTQTTDSTFVALAYRDSGDKAFSSKKSLRYRTDGKIVSDTANINIQQEPNTGNKTKETPTPDDSDNIPPVGLYILLGVGLFTFIAVTTAIYLVFSRRFE